MIRVGTCSWADESFVKAYYPPGVDRLGYYAERFDVVEANSTYYRLPDEALVAQWADKLPDGFVMHVKAFGLMTRHPVKVGALPEDLRGEVSVDERGRVDHPPAEVREEVFRRFVAALEPLREAGKLGGILMQMAPYVVPRQSSYDYLAWAREQLGSHTMLVEFRHQAWFDQAEKSLDFLARNDMTHVIVDTPVFPVVVARTAAEAYVRFTAATGPRGTSARPRPPSALTTCTPRPSSPTGHARCESSPRRAPRTSTRCSTTTADQPPVRRPGTSLMSRSATTSRRRRRTPRP